MMQLIHSNTTLSIQSITLDAEQLQILPADDLIAYGLTEEEKSVLEFIVQWRSADETIAVTTSGSTGTPKTIKLQKQHMVNSAKMTGAYFKLEPRHRALLCLPVAYIAGKMMLVRALTLGLELMIVSPASNPLLTLEDQLIDFAAMIPMQVNEAINTPETKTKLEHIKQVIVGGGAVNHTLHQQIKKLPNQFYATYGMTETITHIAVKQLNGNAASDIYQALKGVSLNQDTRGCLTISAPHLSEEKIVTNDLVEFEDFGKFRWLGRFDNVINSGGIKIVPEKIEKKLESILDRKFFITWLPDKVLGEKVILIIEGEEFDTTTLHLFNTHLSDQLDKYEVPKEVFFVKKFQYTETGKVQRNATKQSLT
jgi:O-succinylbenzoic acid--CoA ligase